MDMFRVDILNFIRKQLEVIKPLDITHIENNIKQGQIREFTKGGIARQNY